MFGIKLCLIAFAAVSLGDKISKDSQCYDCHYDPDTDKHRGTAWGQFPGFPKCAMYDSVEIGRVDRWQCKTGQCFIRQDPNGLLYRGCADPANLPWGVDSTRNCQYQGQIPSLWYFCHGDLCNGGHFGSENICSNDNQGLDDFYVETVHGSNNRPDYDADYGNDENKYQYQNVPEQDGSLQYNNNENYDDLKYQLPREPEKHSGVDFEFYSEQYMNENNVPRIEEPVNKYNYAGYDNKNQDVTQDYKKSGMGTPVNKKYPQKNSKAPVTPSKKSQNTKTSGYQPQPQKKQPHPKSPPPSKKSPPASKKSPPPIKQSSQPSKKTAPPMQSKDSNFGSKKQPMPYSKNQPQKRQYNFEKPSYTSKRPAYEPTKSNQKKPVPQPKYYQQQNVKSDKSMSKSSSSSSESQEGYKTGKEYYKTGQQSNKYAQPNYKSPKSYQPQQPHYKSEGPGPDYANGGIYTDQYEPPGEDFGTINEQFPLDYYTSENKYYQQQPNKPFEGVEKSGYGDEFGDYSENKFGINDKFMGSPDPDYKPNPYSYGDDDNEYAYGYQSREEPEQSVYEGINSNEKKLSYVAKTMLKAMKASFNFVDSDGTYFVRYPLYK